MLQDHLWKDYRKITKEDKCYKLKRFSFTQYFTVWSDQKTSPFFDKVGLARHDKHDILKPLEDLQEEDYKLNPNNDLKTAVIVDFMSMIGKVPF